MVNIDRQGGKPGAMQQCRSCRGSGMKVTMRQLGPGMVQQMQSVCSDCSGEGLSIDDLICTFGLTFLHVFIFI